MRRESPKTMALVATFVSIFLCIVILMYGIHLVNQSAASIRLPANITEKQRQEITQIITQYTQQDGTIAIQALQTAINQLAWVDTSRITMAIRYHRLEINTFQPVAVLNDKWFVSISGKRKDIFHDKEYTNLIKFTFDAEQYITNLPTIFRLQKKLELLDFSVTGISITSVGNISVQVGTELHIHLGIADITRKIDKLAKRIHDIRGKGKPIRIDLRNTRGIAVVYEKQVLDNR